MCGIYAVVGDHDSKKTVDGVNSIKHRGPDRTYVSHTGGLHFTRLSINGLDRAGDQPMCDGSTSLVCNGEIFNHKELENDLGYTPYSNSDCEVLVPLFRRFPFPVFCNKIDGEFAVAVRDGDYLWVARDPYGVRPLFVGTNEKSVAVASEMKALVHSYSGRIEQFKPGHFMVAKTNGEIVQYERYCNNIPLGVKPHCDFSLIRDLFIKAVKKRLMADAKVCCLLSGGLDSSLVAGIARVPTFSIGMYGSTDLRFVDELVDYWGIQDTHTTICLTDQDFIDAVPEVIRAIESYDVTTVRASVGNYLIAKHIRENTDYKVVLNGDYSDELAGGYLYMKMAPNDQDFHDECVRLVQDICYFDSLRSDRSICAHGLEARAPFADKEFLEYYMSISPSIVSPKDQTTKYGLRKAFEGTGILPHDVLWRRKEAFSDGVSSQNDSWHDKMKAVALEKGFCSEEVYYKSIFDDFFGLENRCVIPYKWMPRFCEASDPSARSLQIYEDAD